MRDGLLITGVEVDGRTGVDVRICDGWIAEVGLGLVPIGDEEVVEGGGGALLPGLHDHHIHLAALAAHGDSVSCGPPDVTDVGSLAAALRSAASTSATGDWIRGVGYDDDVAGELDRALLDRLVPDNPVRIQHRSGAMWIVNSRGASRLALGLAPDQTGILRDGRGEPTGRLLHMDTWVRERLGGTAPELGPVSDRLAGFGVTGVTDATATNGPDEARTFRDALASGDLAQRLMLMGGEHLSGLEHPRLTLAHLKVVLAESDLPPLDELAGTVRAAHRAGRPVAVHCVTREALVLALAAFEDGGSAQGDRIEHASVVPPELVEWLARLGLVVVTQPNFVAERGRHYLDRVDPSDVPWLYRGRGFLAAGIRLGGGTDAPFGDPDPWRAMRAAVDREVGDGAILAPAERLTPEEALALFTTPPDAPGGRPRRVRAGAPADLCLLGGPWAEARESLSADDVILTVVGGKPARQHNQLLGGRIHGGVGG